MTKTIAVAGATGELGRRVVHASLARGAKVQALVRGTSDAKKVEALRAAGATIVVLDDVPAVARHLEGVACLVSTLAGLRENIIEAQSTVPRRNRVNAAPIAADAAAAISRALI